MEVPAPGSSSLKAGDRAHEATAGAGNCRRPCARPSPPPPPAERERREGLVELHASFTELFTFFCTNTTIHGPQHLLGSNHSRLRRATWGLLLLGALGIFCWKFILHLQECWGYQATMTVSVPWGRRLSPAVTLCDMNPHRLAPQYLEKLDEFARENIYSLYKFNFSDGRRPTRTTPTAYGPGPKLDFQLDRGLRLQRLSEPGSQCKVGFRLCNSTGGDCFNRAYSSGEKAVREWYHFHYMNILATAQEDSHQNHFILSCQDNSQDCPAGSFKTFHHPIYGSCYTFSNILATTHKDITQGISLVLRVEQQDYLPLLSAEAGIKVMVHGHNHTPFLEPPSLERSFLEPRSFSILPGTKTTISIREEVVHWLRSPYGDCMDREKGVDIPLLYNTSYTMQACLVSCFQQLMVKNCSCGYYRYPLPAGAEYCTYTRHSAWGHCFYRLYQELETHSLSCFSLCLRPCKESLYKLSMWTSRWPSPKSADWVLAVLGSPQNRSQSPRSGIAKVNIYQGINYLKMKETPLPKLFSDMKNLMSQWFGMSVLSLIELLELLLDTVSLALLLGYRWLCEAWASQTGPSMAAGASNTQLEASQVPVSPAQGQASRGPIRPHLPRTLPGALVGVSAEELDWAWGPLPPSPRLPAPEPALQGPSAILLDPGGSGQWCAGARALEHPGHPWAQLPSLEVGSQV
ncbi:LOW QUALITY PROTEIN: amiloride-sensitive sodium channel subunit delta [Trichechus manatus latirostris]|uniref:LOW QUALITY PROTEIN: amiloride-sensitive sodium channel subunit delta n=1 Tax=Trichechus manatus latirostris TaxID=127582 RepID=A0A2Y9RLP7_TRIMA|nr:LOW QUALITY PROTEIN: amiloride-sensitive sodium channel subunit delta [Trichechus manatus latirostris]